MSKVKTRGTELWIGTQASDPVGDSYVQVPGTVQIQGQVGTQWSELDTTELTDTDVQIDKGSRNRGRLTLTGNFHEDVDTGSDPGLAAYKAAADHDSVEPYNIMFVKSNGRRMFFKVSVHQFQHTFGGQNNVLGFTSLIIVKAAPIDLGVAALVAPANTLLPAISGIAVEDGVLTAIEGSWARAEGFTYQWQKNDGGWANIGGATGKTYTVLDADVGDPLRVIVTAANDAGSTAATSAPTPAVIAA